MNKHHHTLTDICWTLFYSNTTFDFLDYMIHTPGYRCIRRIGNSQSGHFLNLLCYKIFRIDLQRTLCIRYLRGYTRTELADKAEQFYCNFLSGKRIQKVWERLPEQNIVLVSGTLDIIAETVARHMQAEAYYASQLEYDQDICTGKLCNDFLRRKAELVHTYPHYDVITDNTSDIRLVLHAEQAVIVVYQNKKRWERLTRHYPHITYIYAHGTPC